MKPVLILLAVFLAVRFIKNSILARTGIRAPEGPAKKGTAPEKEGEVMVLDTVCNSYIPMQSALSLNDGGRTLYFCTEECRDRFLASK